MAVPPFESGDVIFTYSKAGAMRKVITLAQRIGSFFKGGEAKAVHAAIVIDAPVGQTPEICESVTTGLQRITLPPGNYIVWLFRLPSG
jgi:hypothetical protein